MRLGLRCAGEIADTLRVKLLSCFRLVAQGRNGAGTGWKTGTFFRDGGKAILFIAATLHAAHHAVMLAVPAAARREIGIRLRGKERRNQRQAEGQHQGN